MPMEQRLVPFQVRSLHRRLPMELWSKACRSVVVMMTMSAEPTALLCPACC